MIRTLLKRSLLTVTRVAGQASGVFVLSRNRPGGRDSSNRPSAPEVVMPAVPRPPTSSAVIVRITGRSRHLRAPPQDGLSRMTPRTPESACEAVVGESSAGAPDSGPQPVTAVSSTHTTATADLPTGPMGRAYVGFPGGQLTSGSPAGRCRCGVKRALKTAGVRDVRLHDFRHGCVSVLLELKLPPHAVMEIVGHASLEMTMNIYAHVSMDDKKSALDQLGELFEEES